MKNTVLKHGGYSLIIGFIIFSLHLILGIDNLSSSTNTIIGYISIFLSLSFIYLGLKHYRDQINNGKLSLGKAIIIGILISLLAGLGIAIADFIYTAFINPDFFINYEKELIKQGKSDEIIKMTSTSAALFMLALTTVIGFIITLISSLILQRKQ